MAYRTLLLLIEGYYLPLSFVHSFATISTLSVDSILFSTHKQIHKLKDKTVQWKLTYECSDVLSKIIEYVGFLLQSSGTITTGKQALL